MARRIMQVSATINGNIDTYRVFVEAAEPDAAAAEIKANLAASLKVDPSLVTINSVTDEQALANSAPPADAAAAEIKANPKK